jgi:hydroxyethylthiazole kinase
MLVAGLAANKHGVLVGLDSVGAGATRFRTENAKQILDEVDVAVLRANPGEVAALVGVTTQIRGVESIGARADSADLARKAARMFTVVASVTGPVDHVSDGEQSFAISNGHPMFATITGTGCIASAITGCFLAVCTSHFDAAAEALITLGVAGEDAALGAKGPGSFHVNLYDALAALDPDAPGARAKYA